MDVKGSGSGKFSVTIAASGWIKTTSGIVLGARVET
jgi:hypothetical protein